MLFLAAFVVQYSVVSAHGSEPNGTLVTVAGWIAVAVLAVGLAAFRPRPIAGWLLVLGASVLYLVGDAVLASLGDDPLTVAFPSTADWVYLAMYPVLAIAFLVIGATRSSGTPTVFDRSRLLDVGILCLIAAGTIGALYATAAATDDFLSGSAQWVAIAYPAFDVALLGVVAWIALPASSGSRPSGASTLLATGVSAMVVGNTVYNVDVADFVLAGNGVAEAGWLTFTLLLTVAALRPDADRTTAAAVQPLGPVVAGRIRTGVVLTACVAGPVAVLVWADGADLRFTWATFGAAAVALVVRQVRGGVVPSASILESTDAAEVEPATTATPVSASA